MKQPAELHIENKPAVIEPFNLIEEQLRQVRSLISRQLHSHPQTAAVGQLMDHIQARSGKMLRPGLVLLSGSCCGRLKDEHIRVAAVFEIIHDATLLHDDVIDEADQRRGRPTVNKLWGNESAVLLGDFLLSRVFEMSAELDPQIAKSIAVAAGRTCQGELNQNLQKKNFELTEQQYLEIITDKTAAIFVGCCQLGAQLAGAKQADVDMLNDFGLNLGIAFQIADDLTDITGDQDNAGKTLGTDLAKTKPTLPVIHMLSAAKGNAKAELINLLEKNGIDSQKQIVTLLSDNGSFVYSHNLLTEHIDRAKSSLEHMDSNPAKSSLIELAESIAAGAN